MTSLKKLVRKWQNLASLGRKRIAIPKGAAIVDHYKGCFVVSTCDGTRFVIPALDYLKNNMFQQLLRMGDEEYGLQNDGPIRVPFKATLMRYTMSQIERQISKDLEEQLRMAITSWQCLSTSSLQFEQVHTQLFVC